MSERVVLVHNHVLAGMSEGVSEGVSESVPERAVPLSPQISHVVQGPMIPSRTCHLFELHSKLLHTMLGCDASM